MASIVVNGDTSGAVTLSAPAVAGTVTVTLPATSGTMLTTASSTGISGSAISSGTVPEAYGGTGTSTGYYGFKNRIINGAMVIDQRNAGASITPTDGQYSVDRWKCSLSQASKYSAQQSTTAPSGFINSLKITSLSAYSSGASDYFVVQQAVEGFNIADLAWGSASASAVTLSFRVYSSLTGTFGGALQNNAGNRSYPFTYTISSANTWTTISITIAGDTSGTWLTTNATGIFVYFNLGTGTTYSGTAGSWAGANYLSATGATSVVGTNGATFYITGVQLEKGSTATSFDYRPYSAELAMCQRYFYMVSKGTGEIGIGWNYTSSQASWIIYFPVTMRTAPSLYYNNGAYYNFYRNSNPQSITTFNVDVASTSICTIYNNTEISGTAGQAGILRTTSGSGYVGFSAEL